MRGSRGDQVHGRVAEAAVEASQAVYSRLVRLEPGGVRAGTAISAHVHLMYILICM